MSGNHAVIRIMNLATDEKGTLVVATLALLVTSGLNLAYPQLIRIIIDGVTPGGDPSTVDRYVLGLFILFGLVAVVTAGRMYLFELAGERIVMRLRQRLFDAIIQQDVAFFDERKSGEMLNRLTADTTVVQNAATVNLSMGLRFSLAAIGSLLILSFTSLELTLVMLTLVPPAVIGTRLYGRWIKRLSTRVQDELAETTGIAEESIAGIRTVKVFDATSRVSDRFNQGLQTAFVTAKLRAQRIATFGGLAGLVGYGAVCGVLWYGGRLYVENKLSMGELTSFMLYTFTIAFSISALGTVWQSFMKAAGASKRVFEVIDSPTHIKSGPVVPIGDLENLHMEALYFAYSSRPEMSVLEDVSFALGRGEKIAIVGPSGAGKSTIASLIARLYDPQKGRIAVNGIPLENVDLSWWRSQLGVVFQNVTLFADSVQNNLLLGSPTATSDQLWHALRTAQLESFVRSLPQGLDTEIGERGVQLSGGQRQRLAIARVILKDPPLVLLDEATSALDGKTELSIKEALDSMLESRTAIIIAHRLSTVIDADRILYLENGKLVATGTHVHLIETCAPYRQLVQTQMIA